MCGGNFFVNELPDSSYANPSDVYAREAVMLGASLAGIAFSNRSVALIHGMARPIGVFFHVAHGLTTSRGRYRCT